jgi:hypothetical protein
MKEPFCGYWSIKDIHDTDSENVIQNLQIICQKMENKENCSKLEAFITHTKHFIALCQRQIHCYIFTSAFPISIKEQDAKNSTHYNHPTKGTVKVTNSEEAVLAYKDLCELGDPNAQVWLFVAKVLGCANVKVMSSS